MITQKDIKAFFDYEAEASKKAWDNLIKLPIEERIKKRKAIRNVLLDKDYREYTAENNILLKLHIKENLSDFKEGERVLLHKEHLNCGISCEITEFDGDNIIIVEIYNYNFPSDLDNYYNLPLLLDKDYLDLRINVYDNFIVQLPYTEDNFWKDLILNTKKNPTFVKKDKYSEELDDTIKNFNLSLLPKQREAILNSMSADDYYLIQGPPGTGKSFVLSFIILEEIAYLNHKVIVIGPNHMAINNALIQVAKNCPGYISSILKIGKPYQAPNFKIMVDDDTEIEIQNGFKLNTTLAKQSEYSWVIGLTPHSLYTSKARGLECDTLIIDEAGQMTIPLALMGMIKAKKVIFAGDYKQLPPIITSDEIPKIMRQSIFQRLKTDENCTLLNTSFRMCKTICKFVSEIFYDNKIESIKQEDGSLLICDNPLYSFDTPIVFQHINDDGKQTSDKEAEFISNTIINYINLGISPEDIAVLSPFRAQIANIKRHLRKTKSLDDDVLNQIAIDTIDKMQGQEREIIFLTLVSGDIEYMTEMADFLYNPNKLNVAFSRAKSKLIIVGNMETLKEIDRCTFPHIHKMLESEYIHII